MQRVSAGKPNSEINVTPLVDVMLVLLIIFMVITPMLQQGPAVKLPVTADPPTKPEDKSQILVAVTVKNEYTVGKEETLLPEAAFKAKIAEEFQRNSKAPVVIKADSRLTYGDVKKAMGIVKEAGFESVGLIAEKEHK